MSGYTTNVYVLPLVPAPANEWQTLLTVLQQAQHINTQVVGPDRKTVITLDMDLYSRALRLQTLKPDMHKNVILRIGEFHTVLCTLRALGSTIESSGIDEEAWVDADLYGPTTTRQILEGKHMKRALDAHTVTLQAFFELLVEGLDTSLLSKLMQETDNLGAACMQEYAVGARMLHYNLISAMDKSSFFETLEAICKTGEQVPMFKFTYDYMKAVAVLFIFIQASREGLWLLHLASLEELCQTEICPACPRVHCQDV